MCVKGEKCPSQNTFSNGYKYFSCATNTSTIGGIFSYFFFSSFFEMNFSLTPLEKNMNKYTFMLGARNVANTSKAPLACLRGVARTSKWCFVLFSYSSIHLNHCFFFFKKKFPFFSPPLLDNQMIMGDFYFFSQFCIKIMKCLKENLKVCEILQSIKIWKKLIRKMWITIKNWCFLVLIRFTLILI